MQAMSAGALQGDEFRSIAENIPVLMDVLAKQLGVTRGELKKLGAEGKITTDIMIKGLETFGPEAKRTFESADATFSQTMTVWKNHAVEFLGDTVNIARALKDWRAATADLRNAEMDQMQVMARSNEAMGALASRWDQLTAAEYAAIKASQQSIDINNRLAFSLGKLAEMMQVINGIKFVDPWGDARSGWERFKDRVADKATIVYQALSKHADDYAAAAKRAADETGRIADAFAKMQRSPIKAVLGSELGGQDAYQRYVEAEVERLSRPPEPDLEADLRAFEARQKPRSSPLHDMWMRELDQMQRANEQFASDARETFQDIGQSLVDAAFRAEISWDHMLRSVALNMTKLLAMQAMRSQGLDTSLLGGLRLPGFASGGSFMVAGHGGTDTTPVAFMATPGERVTVETPGPQNGPGAGSPAPVSIAIHLDERDAARAMETPEGQRVIVKVIKRMYPQLRSELLGR